MKHTNSPWKSRIFILAFSVLTFFCWCPVFYSSYGPAERILGVPAWAVLSAIFGIALFILEWIYLFAANITATDDDLPDILSQLAKVNTDDTDSPKEEK